MKIGVFLPNNLNAGQTTILNSFGRGLIAHGHSVFINGHDEPAPCDVAIVFGWNKPYHKAIEREVRACGGRVLILNYGLFDRPTYWVAGWDDMSGRSDFLNGDSPSDRWEMMGKKLKPWRSDGDHILVTCQVPTDGSVAGIDIIEWSRSAVSTIKCNSDRPIVFRPHPLAARETPDIEGAARSEEPFEDDLKNAWAIVTYNSTSSSMAIIEGVPVFAMDRGSMAWSIANRSLKFIDEPELFDRTQWANDIGYCQWTQQEFENGEAWEHLRKGA